MNIETWAREIDETTQYFKEEFGSLSISELNWKPNPASWSIAQNMEHLIVINKTYFPVIQQVHDGTYVLPWIGKIGFMVRFMGNTLLKSVQPSRKRKMKTFPLWEPSKSEIAGDILDRFIRHQDELKQLVSDSIDLLDKATIISSPANANIVYELKTAFDIIVTHEKRHLEQARETLVLMKSNNHGS